MAQLLSFNGMPNIPGFQFWATRGALLPPPTTGFQTPGGGTAFGGGLRVYFVTCIANTAHAIEGALVEVTIAGTRTVVFEFTAALAPGHVPVVVANNATAAQCATALETAINDWAETHMPAALTAGAAALGDPALVGITGGAAQVALLVETDGTLSLAVTNNGGRMYGDILLRNASRAFVYTGYDPVGDTAVVFPNGPGGSPADIAFMFLPLTPVIPRAFPSAIINPLANEKP
ncbi:MAG TPA: hypothetical protein VK571_09090 [Gemmatimonadaceae bacterium]|nr:hypothetical protein [Gemmatimonadaceae bacterium]